MIVPTRRFALVLAALLPLALAPALVAPAWGQAWAVALAVTLGAFALDALLAPPDPRLRVDVQAPKSLVVGEAGEATLTVSAPGWTWPVPVQVVVDVDGEVLPDHDSWRGLVSVGRAATFPIPLVPRRRGMGQIESAWVRWTGPLGFAQRRTRRPTRLAIPVTPDLRLVREAALRFASRREFLVGSKVERYVGEGSEFESLREYVPGFDLRAVDWKASARKRRLMAREFRAERNHQVVLAVDAGYLMSEPIGGVPRLDHAISAALLLGYVALRTGDRVGLAAFDERPRAFLEPHRGPRAFLRLERAVSSIDYTRAETNFALGVLALQKRLDRRSLVVVLTDFADSVSAELMVETLGRLARRHLVLFVALRDTQLESRADQAPRALADLAQAVVARDLIRERDSVLERLRRQGIHCLDAAPGRAATHAVRRYLEIRRRELV